MNADRRAAIDAAVATFVGRLRDDAGDVVDLLDVTMPQAGVFRIVAPDHLPIEAVVSGAGVIAFRVTRRHRSATFEHLGDALTFGEPYPLGDKTPADLPTASIDTTGAAE